MQKKKFVTHTENSKGKNIKSIDRKTKKVIPNKELVKKAEDKKLPGYIPVKPKNKEKYLRSKPDKTKKNNLDPKRKII